VCNITRTLHSQCWDQHRSAVRQNALSLWCCLDSFTHRRSVVKRGGCLFACVFVRTITSERLNAGWWNLVVRYIVQKSRLSSNVKVQGWGNQGQKMRIALPTPPGAYEWYVLTANSMQQQRTGPFYGCQGVLRSCVVRQFYAGGKITPCCLVLVFVFILL